MGIPVSIRDIIIGANASQVEALPIQDSLRFRGSQKLTRSVAGSGTLSVWIRRGRMGYSSTIAPNISFASNDTLNGSTATFRDSSAWYHIVTNSGNTYVNGIRVGSATAPTSGVIGTSYEGHMAEMHFVDGQSLDPETFGGFDNKGVWVPIEVTGLTYGTNGFYLKFSDTSNPGLDSSGRGNNFTASSIETNRDMFSEDIRTETAWPPRHVFYMPGNGSYTMRTYEIRIGATYANNRQEGVTMLTNHRLPKSGKYWIPFNWDYGTNSPTYKRCFLWLCPFSETGTYGWNIYSNGRKRVGRYRNHGNDGADKFEGSDRSSGSVSSGGTNQPHAIFLDCDNGQGRIANAPSGNITYGSGSGITDTPYMTWTPGDDYIIGWSVNSFDNGFGNVTDRIRYNTNDIINVGTVPSGYQLLTYANLPDPVLGTTVTGSFTGNNSSDGPFVFTGCLPGRIQYGSVDVTYANRLSQSNVDFLANGFKVRSTTSNSGTVNWTVTTTHSGGEYSGNKVPYGGSETNSAPACFN